MMDNDDEEDDKNDKEKFLDLLSLWNLKMNIESYEVASLTIEDLAHSVEKDDRLYPIFSENTHDDYLHTHTVEKFEKQ